MYSDSTLISSLPQGMQNMLTQRWGTIGNGAPLPTDMAGWRAAQNAYMTAHPPTPFMYRHGPFRGLNDSSLISSLSPNLQSHLTQRWNTFNTGNPLPSTLGDFWNGARTYWQTQHPDGTIPQPQRNRFAQALGGDQQ